LLIVATLCSCATTKAKKPTSAETNRVTDRSEGYFLTGKQKFQLIFLGGMEDEQGQWYDIWICPGYKYPLDYGAHYDGKVGPDLHEYVEKQKYQKIQREMDNSFRFAFEDCFHDFMWEGTGKAWEKYLGRAKKRVDKRVFGWWLAYPWAVMQSTVDNVFRIPLGLLGTSIGTVWGAAVVPTAHMLAPTCKAVWHGGVQGTFVPASMIAWNTVASPPLALLGQRPSPSRVDGFWVRMGKQPPPWEDRPTKEELEAIVQLAQAVERETEPFEEERAKVTREIEEKIEALRREKARRLREINEKEQKRIQEMAKDEKYAEIYKAYQKTRWTAPRRMKYSAEIWKALQADPSMTDAERHRLLRLMDRFPLTPASFEPIGDKEKPRGKTSPPTEVFRVLEEMGDEDGKK